jgi:hypothetical protein
MNRYLLLVVMAAASTIVCLPANAEGCDKLEGSYGFSRNGTAGFGSISAAAVGVISFDGAGNISGNDTTSVNGTIIRRTFVGSYTLNSDCTGSLTITFLTGTPGRVSPNDFVGIDNGLELRLINTNPGEVIVGTARKQLTKHTGNTTDRGE